MCGLQSDNRYAQPAHLHTVAGQIPVDKGLPSLERADTDHETRVSPTVGDGPWCHALRQLSG